MPKRLLVLLAIVVVAVCCPAIAVAAPVLVPQPGGGATVRQDPFLPADAEPGTAPLALVAHAARRPRVSERTVRSELRRLHATGAIPGAAYRRYRASFEAALRAVRRLNGTRAYELQAVVTNLHDIAVAGLLSVSRLPALFLTLDRNREWWTTEPLLSPGVRVEFPGSELVWEYYPGQGIELQVLGSFGKADGLYTAGSSDYPRLHHLLSELIPMAAKRAGGIAWEYYFNFDGGSPPWTSAMSQGTALEALTRAYRAFGDRSYLETARRALRVFHAAPPVGVAVPAPRGLRYVLYSFAPGAAVINGFLQTLIGLYDYARASGNADAHRLFAAGDAEARAELPSYDTGAWSLYQPGQEDTLDYHRLVTGFLHELCARTGASAYCVTARRFDSYLTTAPQLTLLTLRARRGQATSIRFRLSKASHVGIVLVRNGQTVFLTSADFSYGVEAFAIPALGSAGTYTIRLAATDLAGNFNRIVRTLEVS